MTERVVIDARGRARTVRRAYGMRADARVLGAAGLGDGVVSPDEMDARMPLDADLVSDPSREGHPAAMAEREEMEGALERALGTLTEAKVYCLKRWAMGEQNWATAAALGITWRELVKVRAGALARLGTRFEAPGWIGGT